MKDTEASLWRADKRVFWGIQPTSSGPARLRFRLLERRQLLRTRTTGLGVLTALLLSDWLLLLLLLGQEDAWTQVGIWRLETETT